MKKGGYKIIDFNGAILSGEAVEITGIYESIVNNYDKAILVSGVSLNGELQGDAYAAVTKNDNSVTLAVYDGVITVTEDDEITFASVSSNAKLTEDVANLINNSVTLKTTLTDANNADTGWYYVGPTTPNLPTESAYFLLSMKASSHKAQLAIHRTTGDLYSRANTGGTWLEWKKATNA